MIDENVLSTKQYSLAGMVTVPECQTSLFLSSPVRKENWRGWVVN